MVRVIEHSVCVEIGGGPVYVNHTLAEFDEAIRFLRFDTEAPDSAFIEVTKHAITAHWGIDVGNYEN